MRKIFNVLLAVLLMSFSFSTIARAAEPQNNNYEAVIAKVDQANAQINQKIETAVAAADRVTAQYDFLVGRLDANDPRVGTLTVVKDTLIDMIVSNLVAETDRIAQDAKNFGAKYGYTVECHYEEVIVGGQSVLIDPLRVPSD